MPGPGPSHQVYATEPEPPPRSSSLLPPPRHPEPDPALPRAPPLPLPLTLPPAPLPLPDDPPPQHDLHHLPTYEQVRAAEPNNHRFGRWHSWVRKRALESRAERDHSRAALPSTPWDLPACGQAAAGSESFESSVAEEVDARERDERAERRLSGSGGLHVANPDDSVSFRPWIEPRTGTSSGTSSPVSPATPGGGRSQRLTTSVSLQQLGSRFDKHLPEKPLCGMVLPTRASGDSRPEDERFILTGTAEGLYLADLNPSLSSGPLRASHPNSQLEMPARILPIWSGLGVHQLDCFLEPSPRSASARGVVFGLVDAGNGELEVRMWSLASLLSLAQWRVFNESSVPVTLSPPAPPPAPSASSPNRRTSSGAFQSLFTHAPSYDKDSKGKDKVDPSPPPIVRRSSIDSDYLVIHPQQSSSYSPHTRNDSTSTTAFDVSMSRSASGLPPPSSSSAQTGPSQPQSTPRPYDLPHEWASASVRLPLPRGHTPVLFFHLSRFPARSEPEHPEADDDSDDDEDVSPERRRFKRELAEEKGRLFLLVATAKVVYLFESRPSKKRTWVLTKELSAPSTPRFLRLVRSPPSSRSGHRSTPSSSAVHAIPFPSSAAPSPYPTDLCLLLGLSHRSVLVRLSDSSVQELGLSLALTRSRPRRPSVSNSVRSTASSHRSPPSLSLKGLRDNPLVAKVAALVEGKNAIPAGFRGMEKTLALGKKVRDDPAARAHEDTAAQTEGGRWVGCEELVVDTASEGQRTRPRRFYLLSKGHSTHVVCAPLMSLMHSAANVSPPRHTPPTLPLLPTPIHTFTWATEAPLQHVVAFLSPDLSPPASSHLVVVAFTATGLSIQEGHLSHPSIERLFDPSFSPSSPHFGDSTDRPTPAPLRFFTPTTASTSFCPRRSTEDEDEDLSDSATLDFGRETGWLCASGTPGRGGGYLWTRAHSDYVLKKVVGR
ncbi:hypothetical protein JCM5296_003161 [Sporobolomyces johnsonii]